MSPDAFLYLFFIRSATSVDVEESLYKRAQALGISVVTISQVYCVVRYIVVDEGVGRHVPLIRILKRAIIELFSNWCYFVGVAATCSDSLSCNGASTH